MSAPFGNSARGNAAFLVLIGVLLFGLLAYAITQGFRGGNSTVSEEKARLDATEIVQYGAVMRPVIDRMMLLNRVTGAIFAASGANAAYGTPGNQPTSEIFNNAGGKLIYQTPPQEACVSACDYEFSGQYTVTGVGTGSPDLAMLVIDLTQQACEAINNVLDLGWSSVPTGGALTLTRFDGSTYGGANAITLTGASNEFVDKRAFCYRESSGGQRYIFVEVLRAR